MKIKDSETEFDGWSELHVFAVIQINGNVNWSRVFGKTTSVSQGNNTAWHYAARRGDYNPIGYTFHLRPIPQVRIIGDRKITAIRITP